MTKLNTFQQVRELDGWRANAFACALVQRMLPNYQLFCEATEFADATELSNLVNLLWEALMTPKTKINHSVQLDKVEEATPEVKDFDNYGVYPALDFSVSLEAALNLLSGDDPQGAVVISKVSQGTVEAFIDVTAEQELSNEEIKAHPMMQREIVFQQALLEKIRELKTRDKAGLQDIRHFACLDGMSNIGIAMDAED